MANSTTIQRDDVTDVTFSDVINSKGKRLRLYHEARESIDVEGLRKAYPWLDLEPFVRVDLFRVWEIRQ